MSTPKDTTTLEKMKAIEDKKKKAQLLKIMNLLKNAARNVQEWKEICELYLQELSTDDKERKQIIDWINSLSDVQVNDERHGILEDRVHEELKEEKERIEKEMTKFPEKYLTQYQNLANFSGTSLGSGGTTTTSTMGIGSLNLCASASHPQTTINSTATGGLMAN